MTYCIDESHPLASVLEAKYYSEHKDDEIFGISCYYNFEELVEYELEPNTQYIRYWHGSIGIMRILLMFMNLEQIYIFNAIMLSILSIILIVLLCKKKAIALVMSFIVGMVMVVSIVVPFCLEYTWTFYIMLITSILAIIWNDKKEKLNLLFFITGMIICFLDFLSTEIITIAVPLLIVLVLRAKDKKITNGKEAVLLIFKSVFLWGVAYVSMWFAKWIIASFVLQINAFNYVKWQAQRRINGKISGIKKNELWWYAISRNINTLYPLNILARHKKLKTVFITIATLEVIVVRKKNFKKLWLSGAILLIGLLPYARYILLSNHSYTHYFFTFRSQIVTIMAIVLAIIYSIDIEFWKEKIKNRRKKWN